jgi:hypothetical protein
MISRFLSIYKIVSFVIGVTIGPIGDLWSKLLESLEIIGDHHNALIPLREPTMPQKECDLVMQPRQV